MARKLLQLLLTQRVNALSFEKNDINLLIYRYRTSNQSHSAFWSTLKLTIEVICCCSFPSFSGIFAVLIIIWLFSVWFINSYVGEEKIDKTILWTVSFGRYATEHRCWIQQNTVCLCSFIGFLLQLPSHIFLANVYIFAYALEIKL